MARYFGEQIRPSQCNRMCDVCEFMGAAEDAEMAASGPAAAAAAGSSIQPHSSPFFMRDLSEAAIQLCDWLSSQGGADAGAPARGKGKRRRASTTAGGITQKGVVDECRKKTSSVRSDKLDAHQTGRERQRVARLLTACRILLRVLFCRSSCPKV